MNDYGMVSYCIQTTQKRDAKAIQHGLSLQAIFSVMVIAAGLWLMVLNPAIILLLVIALILASTVSPILTWLERHPNYACGRLGLVLSVL